MNAKGSAYDAPMAAESICLDEILSVWRQWKSRSVGRRLAAPCMVEHEYQGKQWGHPSTYAFVRFECMPAQELVFEMRAKWPPHLTPEYRRLLHQAMAAAIVDGLVATDDPRTGCSVSCIDVKWDDVTSSERAFYRATRAAMTALCEHEWSPASRTNEGTQAARDG
jgi:hypothetical protein